MGAVPERAELIIARMDCFNVVLSLAIYCD